MTHPTADPKWPSPGFMIICVREAGDGIRSQVGGHVGHRQLSLVIGASPEGADLDRDHARLHHRANQPSPNSGLQRRYPAASEALRSAAPARRCGREISRVTVLRNATARAIGRSS
jgi:hypothetical protein